MKLTDPYTLADKAAKLLREKIVKRFRKTQKALTIAGFDELNVIKSVKTLYQSLDSDNKQMFTDTAKGAYDDAWILILAMAHELKIDKFDEKRISADRAITRNWVLKALKSDNEITKYIYEHEIERKQEYTVESINAVKTKTAKRQQLEKGMYYWDRMSAQYLDIMTDNAMMQAYEDAGIEYVQWKTEQDDRVCETCKERHDKIYRIDLAPPKAHWHCRCWYVPVIKK